MNQSFTVRASEISLRAITRADCENLRAWKNANRFAFFYQETISPAQQAHWFEKYLTRADDYMFIVEIDARAIGCMGFRLIENRADIYNVILGEPVFGKRGWMRAAMRVMCSFIRAEFTSDIGAQVLRANPATAWYRKCGFREQHAHETYFDFALDPAQFQPCEFQIARMDPSP